jgi:class 3 adenylate cyclase
MRGFTQMGESPLPIGTVTFLFSDIEESTDLVRRLGNAIFAEVRGHHRRLLRDAFRAHGGHEIDTAGDGFFVAFDSARDAVAAAIEGQLALRGFEWPEGAAVRVRVGLHTAEPLLSEDGYVGVGVTRASRICDAGRGGQILVSNATAGIVEDADLVGVVLTDLGLHRLKGLRVKQRLFQVTAPGLESAFGPPRTTDAATRKPGTGTFLVADLTNWQHVLQAVGDEATAMLTRDYHARTSATVEAHHGAVLELVGDTVLAVFHSASDALRAASATRELVGEMTWPDGVEVSVTIAVHSGRWSGNPEQPDAGTALSKVMQLGHSVELGNTIVSATTAALVEGDRSVPTLRRLGRQTAQDDKAVFGLETN